MDYKYKYLKYKHKYIALKKQQHGGARDHNIYKQNGILYKKFRTNEGKYVSYTEKEPSRLDDYGITNDLKPDSNKILIIDNIQTFDGFTTKYGDHDFFENDIKIKWDRVANDFAGFYVDPKLKYDRYALAPVKKYKPNYWQGSSRNVFKVYRPDSWWKNEYEDLASGVMIFRKD